jgi:NAD(P)-dependent dehydrogenase (short-subunit alcohol dehydrogenase family)
MTALQTALHMEVPLTGKVALVTGAAGGLGTAITHELADAGAQVVGIDIQPASPDSSGDRPPLRADVTNAAELQGAIAWVIRDMGRLDILINNAGIDVTAPIEDISVEQFDQVVAVNLRAPFIACRAVFPHMREIGGGQIVNIASTAALRAWPNASAYHATKYGLLGLSHALSAEGKAANIRVTAVIAGGMRTPFLLDRFPDIDQSTLQDPAAVASAIRYVLSAPLGTTIPEIMVLPVGETSWP